MVKLKGPCVSDEASGKLAQALIFSTAKKRAYVKQHADPTQPRTGPQRTVRASMKWLSQQWSNVSTADRDTWLEIAHDHQVAPYHAFIKYNQARWATFRTATKVYPAAETSTTPKAPFTSGAIGIKMATINLPTQIPPPLWGYALMRNTAPIGASQWDLVVAMFPYFWPDTNTYYVDQLETGTYYYRTFAFNPDGVNSPRGAQWIAVIA